MKQLYEDQGFVGPLEAFSPDEVRTIAGTIREELERHHSLSGRRNRHLDWPLVKHLCMSEAIVQAMTAVIGPDLVLWRSNIFSISGADGLPWHQDEYHTLLSDPYNHTSVHLAITASDPDNCLLIIPGSHKFRPENMGKHGFLLVPGSKEYPELGTPRYFRVDSESTAPVRMMLEPGQFVLFHPSLMHGSKDNLRVRRASLRKLRIRLRERARQFRANRRGKKSRLALGLRATVPQNKTLPAAFSETLPRIDKCVMLHGSNNEGENDIADWDIEAAPRQSSGLSV